MSTPRTSKNPQPGDKDYHLDLDEFQEGVAAPLEPSYGAQKVPVGTKCFICGRTSARFIKSGEKPICQDCYFRHAPVTDVEGKVG